MNVKERSFLSQKRFNYLQKLSLDVFKASKEEYEKDYVVVGDGNYSSNTLIIGEAPGRNEEEQKRIFIGRSGQILRKVLSFADIEKKSLFINCVPWRPDNNRTPLIDEIKFYSKFWNDLIDNMDIKNILCVGRQASNLLSFLDVKNKNLRIISTYHPSYFLRTRKPDVLEHMFTSALTISTNCSCLDNDCYVFTHSSQRSS